ncbi:hypothetical protein DL93DRAFT_2072605, partial [Clavulina sp. PMI_390]
MARDAPSRTAKVISPQKRRLAASSASHDAWTTLEIASTSGSRATTTPRRRLPTAPERVHKNRILASDAYEDELEDGMNLISTFGVLGMCVAFPALYYWAL